VNAGICWKSPLENWFELIGDPTVADAILDRLIHNAHKINLKGESMRKIRSPLTKGKNSVKENISSVASLRLSGQFVAEQLVTILWNRWS
jgi:hypothetical protein